MEGTQSQLCARLTNGLRGNDTDSGTQLNDGAAAQIHAIALLADTVGEFACHWRADFYFGDAGVYHLDDRFMIHQFIAVDKDLAGLRVDHPFSHGSSIKASAHRLAGDIVTLADDNTVVGAAVIFVDDHILRNVNQTAGQVTGIRGTQSGIGQTFTGAMGGDEVFEGGKAFAEV